MQFYQDSKSIDIAIFNNYYIRYDIICINNYCSFNVVIFYCKDSH